MNIVRVTNGSEDIAIVPALIAAVRRQHHGNTMGPTLREFTTIWLRPIMADWFELATFEREVGDNVYEKILEAIGAER